jgi:glycosidase
MPRSLLLLSALAVMGCNALVESPERDVFPETIKNATVYEVNIRQYSPEGTLKAFTADLPRLKELGVGVLWIMPVQPIGEKNRKGSLGSYYSIREYAAINPEFGTEADFGELVTSAHELGMYVILDWVPNHTAYDNPWITEHPEYYVRDSVGNILHEADWTDIALLDHTNPGTRSAMIGKMNYWVEKFDIDGFRCDHAGHEIPLYFWEEARAALDPVKDLFWLAEWDGARMHLKFDATYAWELLHLTEHIAKGEKNANDLAAWIEKDIKEFGMEPFRMTMITNHDENSWAGTEFERYGDGVRTFATFIFTAYGIPMLYTGQEAGLNKRLRFFEKDTVDWSDPTQLQPFYRKLTSLRAENKALWSGKYGGMPVRINDDDSSVYAFKREKDGNRVIGILNVTGRPAEFRLDDVSVAGTYTDVFTGKSFELAKDEPIALSPWQCLVFVR